MIFVTGCARSGTSLVAKLLQAHGANLGPVNVLYENTRIRQGILKPYLSSIGADSIGQSITLPDAEDLRPYPDLRDKILDLIPGSEPRAYKDAKLCHVWQIFAEAFSDARWIIVRRDKEKIVESCLRPKTSEGFNRFMRRSDDPYYWRRWVKAHEERFVQMLNKLPFAIEVWTDFIVEDPGVFDLVTSFVGLEFSLEKTEKVIDRNLWHHASRTTAVA